MALRWMILCFLLTATASMAQALDPRNILFIGDSHATQTFGLTMDKQLRAHYGDATVLSYASCGSRASSWLNDHRTHCGYRHILPGGEGHETRRYPTPRMADLLSKYRPAITIVSLGANHMGQSQERFVGEVRALALLIRDGGSQCLWVGPPPCRGNPHPRGLSRAGIQDLLSIVLADLCTVIDSSHYVRYPSSGGDGIHFDGAYAHGVPRGRSLARQWARGVFNAAVPLLDLAVHGYTNLENPAITAP